MYGLTQPGINIRNAHTHKPKPSSHMDGVSKGARRVCVVNGAHGLDTVPNPQPRSKNGTERLTRLAPVSAARAEKADCSAALWPRAQFPPAVRLAPRVW